MNEWMIWSSYGVYESIVQDQSVFFEKATKIKTCLDMYFLKLSEEKKMTPMRKHSSINIEKKGGLILLHM